MNEMRAACISQVEPIHIFERTLSIENVAANRQVLRRRCRIRAAVVQRAGPRRLLSEQAGAEHGREGGQRRDLPRLQSRRASTGAFPRPTRRTRGLRRWSTSRSRTEPIRVRRLRALRHGHHHRQGLTGSWQLGTRRSSSRSRAPRPAGSIVEHCVNGARRLIPGWRRRRSPLTSTASPPPRSAENSLSARSPRSPRRGVAPRRRHRACSATRATTTVAQGELTCSIVPIVS